MTPAAAEVSGPTPPAVAEAGRAEQGGARLEGGRSAGEISRIQLDGGRSAGDGGRSAGAGGRSDLELEEDCNLGLAEEVQRRFCLALEPLLALPDLD